MFLTKNNLKRVKKTIDDDDMINYLKYSHLEREPSRTTNESWIKTSDRATQIPDIENNFAQTDKKVMVDKETDTYDDLNKIIGTYVLDMSLAKFKSKEPSRAEKMAQVSARIIHPNSSSSSSSGNSDGSPFLRNVERGLRVAQLTGSAMLTALNIADTVGQATLSPVIGGAFDLAEYLLSNPTNEEEVEDVEVPTDSGDIPQVDMSRERSRSRDSNDELGNRLLERGASRSRSNTPSSGTASSAKTTPRKKSK